MYHKCLIRHSFYQFWSWISCPARPVFSKLAINTILITRPWIWPSYCIFRSTNPPRRKILKVCKCAIKCKQFCINRCLNKIYHNIIHQIVLLVTLNFDDISSEKLHGVSSHSSIEYIWFRFDYSYLSCSIP